LTSFAPALFDEFRGGASRRRAASGALLFRAAGSAKFASQARRAELLKPLVDP
jgi:hypothetical protein